MRDTGSPISCPPFFVAVRERTAAGRRASFPVRRPGRTEAVGAIFSTRRSAERFIQGNDLSEVGFRVLELPDWRRLAVFLEWLPLLKAVSLDGRRLSYPESCAAVKAESLLPDLRVLAQCEAAPWEGAPWKPAPWKELEEAGKMDEAPPVRTTVTRSE